MRVQYADEAVVLIKLKPMKGSNPMEEKTGVTYHWVDVAIVGQKFMIDGKGGRDFKVY